MPLRNWGLSPDLAEALGREIVARGPARPVGHESSRRQWATRFRDVQRAIREAINSLVQNGFVTKESGRGPPGTHLREGEVARVYEAPRASESGHAADASRAAERPVARQVTKDAIGRLAPAGNRQGLLGSDRCFHPELCGISPNSCILGLAGRKLLSFFALARLRLARQRSGNVGLGQRPVS
jgi:DNA-binding GntR family transcriptional regulator